MLAGRKAIDAALWKMFFGLAVFARRRQEGSNSRHRAFLCRLFFPFGQAVPPAGRAVSFLRQPPRLLSSVRSHGCRASEHLTDFFPDSVHKKNWARPVFFMIRKLLSSRRRCAFPSRTCLFPFILFPRHPPVFLKAEITPAFPHDDVVQKRQVHQEGKLCQFFRQLLVGFGRGGVS